MIKRTDSASAVLIYDINKSELLPKSSVQQIKREPLSTFRGEIIKYRENGLSTTLLLHINRTLHPICGSSQNDEMT